MITSKKHRSTLATVMILGVLLTTLAALVSSGPADAALTPGTAFAWGYNYDGQLGNDTNGEGTETNLPEAVRNLSGVKSVKAGCDHVLALKNDGTVRAWGDNDYGQLGDGNAPTDTDLPVKVNIDSVTAVSAGCDHSLALKENGTVWAWGSDRNGELGNGPSGDGTQSALPVRVADIGTGAKAIAAGGEFSLALMKDGTARAWGRNDYGQLGNGTDAPRNTPGAVSNLSNVRAIATDSSARHALALLGDGTVKTWGYNDHGQLGDGTSLPGTYRAKPARVANLTGVRAVAAGGFHSLALMESGRVKSWGNNNQGELGNGNHGDSADRSIPGNVVGLTDVRSVSAGRNHSLAILQSGRARSWGANYYGQLGNGASGAAADSDVPVGVKNLAGVKNIDGGFVHTVAAAQ